VVRGSGQGEVVRGQANATGLANAGQSRFIYESGHGLTYVRFLAFCDRFRCQSGRNRRRIKMRVQSMLTPKRSATDWPASNRQAVSKPTHCSCPIHCPATCMTKVFTSLRGGEGVLVGRTIERAGIRQTRPFFDATSDGRTFSACYSSSSIGCETPRPHLMRCSAPLQRHRNVLD